MMYLFLALYAAILVVIGIYSRKKAGTLDDFFLGGRKMGAWMSAFAYGTTYFSAVIFIGYAGKIGWGFGLSAVWIGLGNALVGSLLAWMVLGKRTRSMTQKLNVATMPEFFCERFDSKGLKIISALMIFIFLVPYSASVYSGLSYLFETVFGISYITGMIIMAAITAVYLILGGYFAIALSDFFQGLIMFFGIGFIIYFVLSAPEVGGLAEGLSRLNEIEPKLTGIIGPGGWWPLVSLIVLTSLGSWGLPQMVHKFYAIKDEKAIKRGTVISTVFALVIGSSAYFLGSFGRLFLNNTVPIDPSSGSANFDMIMPQVLSSALPEILIGIVVVLILSASMSTLESLVLVSSSSISIDLVGGVIAPKMSDKKKHVLMRVLCGLFIVLSFILAAGKFGTIIQLMAVSWGTLSGAFLAPFLYGLFWKKTTKAAAWTGIIGGMAIMLGLYFGFESITSPMAGTIAMLANLVIVPVVSLVTPKMPEDKLAKAFD